MFTIQTAFDGKVNLTLHEAREWLAEPVAALNDPNDDDAGMKETLAITALMQALVPQDCVFIAPPLDGTRARQLERAYSLSEMARDA